MPPVLPPRVPLATAPTPVQRVPRLADELGIELYVKREDLTGFAETGNKIRKLEFLVREALDQGADTLVTLGAQQSNCARATAAVAARLGLRCLLALRGAPPAEPDGNLLLARLFGAEVLYAAPGEGEAPDGLFAALAERVRRAGGRPYLIPESGSNDLGALGYALVVEELCAQIAAGTPAPDTVVVAAWSGGTLAGLLLGRTLFGLDAEIVGVPVAFDAARIRDQVWGTVRKAAARVGVEVALTRDAVRLWDGYQGRGRAGVEPEEAAVVARVAQVTGLLLDPVYTAKAMRALLDQARRYPGRLGRRVLFLHTGGGFGVFPHRAALARVLDAPSPPPA